MAVLALGFSIAGIAIAAIPDATGVIHACYAKNGGALRVVSGNKCAKGERRLSWSARGRPGSTRINVRRDSLVIKYTCDNSSICSAPRTTATASCVPGERATGGGFAKGEDGSAVQMADDKPAPAIGTPNGWTFTSEAIPYILGSSHPDTVVPIYVVCAAG
jgi:hypothetical protein